MSKVARLRIETPNDDCKRVSPRDVRVFLNDVEMQQWRNFRFSVGVDDGCVMATFDIYPDQLEVDSDVFALFNDLNAKQDAETES